MRLRKRAIGTVFVTAAAFTAIASQAMAAPMPWDTSETPTAPTRTTSSAVTSASGTVTVLCVGGCYQ